MIVTKCPDDLSREKAAALRTELKPLPHQSLYFTHYEYRAPYYAFNPRYRLQLEPDLEVLLISAIANTDYLMEYLEQQVAEVHTLEFEDHHYFTGYDMGRLKQQFDRIDTRRKVIITTEKDATRLELHRPFLIEQRLPIFVLPVVVNFLFEEGPQFDQQVKQYLLDFKV
jgi:tetraacyldisaccharide 4'-kinase